MFVQPVWSEADEIYDDSSLVYHYVTYALVKYQVATYHVTRHVVQIAIYSV